MRPQTRKPINKHEAFAFSVGFEPLLRRPGADLAIIDSAGQGDRSRYELWFLGKLRTQVAVLKPCDGLTGALVLWSVKP